MSGTGQTISHAGWQTIYFLYINDLRETKVLARRAKDLNDILMIDELIEEAKK